MSPRLGAITERNPLASSAHTAASRDEPQPKFSAATTIFASRYGCWFRMNSGFSLPSLEVAVRRRRHALALAREIAVHADAHRASRLAPLETGVEKHAVQAFCFRRLLHQARARNDPRRNRHAPAFHDGRCRAQVGE